MSDPKTQTALAVTAAEPHTADCAASLAHIEAECTVTDAVSYAAAPAFVALIKTAGVELAAERAKWEDPHKAALKNIGKAFGPAAADLKDAESLIKKRLAAFAETTATESRDLIAAVGETADPAVRADLLAKAGKCALPKVKGLSLRPNWSGKVTDRAAFVAEAIAERRHDLLMPDEKTLKALTKAADGAVNFPGWEPTVSTVVSITASKLLQ